MAVFAGDMHVLLCKKYNNFNVLMTQSPNSWVICCKATLYRLELRSRIVTHEQQPVL